MRDKTLTWKLGRMYGGREENQRRKAQWSYEILEKQRRQRQREKEKREEEKQIMGPNDPIYRGDMEYETSPRGTTSFLSSKPTPLDNNDSTFTRVASRFPRVASYTHQAQPAKNLPSTPRKGLSHELNT